MTRDVGYQMINFTLVSDRITILQLKAKPTPINFIQVYTPTSETSEEEMEQFYTDINILLKILENNNLLDDIVGNHGLKVRNERGDKFV